MNLSFLLKTEGVSLQAPLKDFKFLLKRVETIFNTRDIFKDAMPRLSTLLFFSAVITHLANTIPSIVAAPSASPKDSLTVDKAVVLFLDSTRKCCCAGFDC